MSKGEEVVGIDNLNEYYDIRLKQARLAQLGVKDNCFEYGKSYSSSLYPLFKFIKLDIADRKGLPDLFAREHFDHVINLAAQAGVRYSLENPFAYVDSNLTGFVNILECCRHYSIEHLTYASSSSVYGGNTKTPFSEDDRVDAPVSLYAATKNQTSLWPVVTQSFIKYQQLGCVFHCIRSMGAPGYGSNPIYKSYFSRRTH